MKKFTAFKYLFLILFFLAFLNPLNSSFSTNLLLIKSHAEDGEEENEYDGKQTESRESKDIERDSDEQEDGDDYFKRTSNSVKVAPVESQVKIQSRTPINIEPNVVAPASTPEPLQALPSLFEEVPTTTIPKIEVSIPTIPSNDQIKQMINNVKELNGVVSSINLEETANGILKGEVITKQKILGLIDIQIPYKVTLDSISGSIKEKFPQGIWNSFLDFISF